MVIKGNISTPVMDDIIFYRKILKCMSKMIQIAEPLDTNI